MFLLILGIGGLWWRSYTTIDRLRFDGSTHPAPPSVQASFSKPAVRTTSYQAASINGELRFDLVTVDSLAETAQDRGKPSHYFSQPVTNDFSMLDPLKTIWQGWVIRYADGRYTAMVWGTADVFTQRIAFPHWLLMAVLSVPFLLSFRGPWRRCRRRKLGLCLACGYDLRASPDRCPECGMAA